MGFLELSEISCMDSIYINLEASIIIFWNELMMSILWSVGIFCHLIRPDPLALTTKDLGVGLDILLWELRMMTTTEVWREGCTSAAEVGEMKTHSQHGVLYPCNPGEKVQSKPPQFMYCRVASFKVCSFEFSFNDMLYDKKTKLIWEMCILWLLHIGHSQICYILKAMENPVIVVIGFVAPSFLQYYCTM